MSNHHQRQQQEQREPLLSKVTTRHLDPEDAETNNIETLEARQQQQQSNLSKPRPTLKGVAQRVALMQRFSSRRDLMQQSGRQRQHRYHASTAQNLLGSIGQQQPQQQHQPEEGTTHNNETSSNNLYLFSDQNADAALLRAAGIHIEGSSSSGDAWTEETGAEENATASAAGEEEDGLPTTYGAIATREQSRRRRASRQLSWPQKACRCLVTCPRVLWRILLRSYFLVVAMPLFVAAWILFYGLGNPEFDFLPGKARLSWWLNFLGRQVITLELARVSQYVVLDWIVLRLLLGGLGPLVTMTALQSRGWPFVLTAWSIWNLLILHGDDEFQVHWFHWTGWRIYNSSSGSYLLNSQGYLRVLLAMMVAGIATTVKRMYVTIRFGRRMLADFKPRMEKLLSDMVLLSEIGDLAAEAGTIADSEQLTEDKTAKKDALANVQTKGKKARAAFGLKGITGEDPSSEDDKEQSEEKSESLGSGRGLPRSPSGSVLLKHLLERWEEPVDNNRLNDSTIHDVLKFKHALDYMDEPNPFGTEFGPIADRNDCIAASHKIFWKLMKCSSSTRALGFDILSLIATSEDGTQDRFTMMALRRLFQPDYRNELTLLAFVQSCDSIYKRLRYFRASVNNATVIDKALERIMDAIYWLLLGIMLLLILQFNPWPVLVSFTSLMVSVSFAMGSSVSKYLEGILLVAVRRPYDLGDRVVFQGAEAADTPGPASSWFVEDISLFRTVLRFAKTNEVSSVNNFSISQSRILNLQRSTNAIVFLEQKVNLSIFEGDKLERFRNALDKYVEERPRIWDSVLYCQHGTIDADWEFAMFTLLVRHRLNWQAAARINVHRGDLVRFLYEMTVQLGLSYDTPVPRRLILKDDPGETAKREEPKKVLDADAFEFDPSGVADPAPPQPPVASGSGLGQGELF